MSRKITKIERIKSKAVRIALTAFRENPSLGSREAVGLFVEIVTHLKSGMNDADVVKAIVNNRHAIAAPSTQQSLM